jgi:hypothetical protein
MLALGGCSFKIVSMAVLRRGGKDPGDAQVVGGQFLADAL